MRPCFPSAPQFSWSAPTRALKSPRRRILLGYCWSKIMIESYNRFFAAVKSGSINRKDSREAEGVWFCYKGHGIVLIGWLILLGCQNQHSLSLVYLSRSRCIPHPLQSADLPHPDKFLRARQCQCCIELTALLLSLSVIRGCSTPQVQCLDIPRSHASFAFTLTRRVLSSFVLRTSFIVVNAFYPDLQEISAFTSRYIFTIHPK